MQIQEVLQEMLVRRNASPKKVSLGMGRSERYISRMKSGGVKLGSETLAEIASFLDYDLVLRDRLDDSGNGDIIIDPPKD